MLNCHSSISASAVNMARICSLLIATVLVSTAYGISISVSHNDQHHSPDWATTPKYEHEEKPSIWDKIKKGKKWLTSWSWKKDKGDDSHKVQYETHHYPVWKIHKYKGIEIRPVQVIDNGHHSHKSEIYAPEIHHETPKPVYIHETIKEKPSPVYHHKNHHSSHYEIPKVNLPIHKKFAPLKKHIHHQEEHHVEEHHDIKWPEEWNQLAHQHIGDAEAEKSLLESFSGEGHSIETLQKMLPTLHKDKKFLEKIKQLHLLKSSWVPKIFGGHSSEPQLEAHHDGHEHNLDSHGHAEELGIHQLNLPEVPDIHLPGLKHIPIPSIPDLPGAYPIHQMITATVLEHPSNHYESHQEPKKHDHYYEEQYPPYSNYIHNSYGENIQGDSYGSGSQNVEVAVPSPNQNQQAEGVQPMATNVDNVMQDLNEQQNQNLQPQVYNNPLIDEVKPVTETK